MGLGVWVVCGGDFGFGFGLVPLGCWFWSLCLRFGFC